MEYSCTICDKEVSRMKVSISLLLLLFVLALLAQWKVFTRNQLERNDCILGIKHHQ